MKKALVAALALIIFFSAGQTVHADSNLIPAIKVAGGWVSVVSYVNTMPVGAGRTVFVHATYQVKNPASLSIWTDAALQPGTTLPLPCLALRAA